MEELGGQCQNRKEKVGDLREMVYNNIKINERQI